MYSPAAARDEPTEEADGSRWFETEREVLTEMEGVRGMATRAI